MSDKHILLIEDNPDDEMLTLRAFQKAGYSDYLSVVRDGAEALDYVLHRGVYQDPERYPAPDLILLDLKLPKIDGREVLKRIRADQHARFIPVVILTSSIEETDIFSCYELGGNSYIRKPIDFERFKLVIERVCEYWLSFNHPAPAGKEETALLSETTAVKT